MKKMSRYIRTKDGQIFHECDFNDLYRNEVIEEADSIEELCDVFVDTSMLNSLLNAEFYNYYENKELIWFDGYIGKQHVSIRNWKDKSVIKGAIWTDKGLIYVAKMNEEGDLELI